MLKLFFFSAALISVVVAVSLRASDRPLKSPPAADLALSAELDRIALTRARELSGALAAHGYIEEKIDPKQTKREVIKRDPPPAPDPDFSSPTLYPNANFDCVEFTFSNGLFVKLSDTGMVVDVENRMAAQKLDELRFPTRPTPHWSKGEADAAATEVLRICLQGSGMKVMPTPLASFSHTAEYGNRFGAGYWHLSYCRATDEGLPVYGDYVSISLCEPFGAISVFVQKTEKYNAGVVKAANAKVPRADAIRTATKDVMNDPDNGGLGVFKEAALVVLHGKLKWDVIFHRPSATPQGIDQVPLTNVIIDALTGEASTN